MQKLDRWDHIKINKIKFSNKIIKSKSKERQREYRQKSDIQAIQREKLIYDLAHYTNGEILNVTNFGTSPSIKLLFCKDEGEEEIKIRIDIKCIENIVVEYLKWRNKENYTYCVECGKEISSITKPKKYCNKCLKQMQYKWEIKSRNKKNTSESFLK